MIAGRRPPSLERRLIVRLALLYVAAIVVATGVYALNSWLSHEIEAMDQLNGLAPRFGAAVVRDGEGVLRLRLPPDLERRVAAIPGFQISVSDATGGRPVEGTSPWLAREVAGPVDSWTRADFTVVSNGRPLQGILTTVASPAGPLRVAMVRGEPTLADTARWVAGEMVEEVLPVVLPVMVLTLLVGVSTVRSVVEPFRRLSAALGAVGPRSAGVPLSEDGVPREVLPMVQAVNHAFARIDVTLQQQRRMTANAAHELRTPLAILRARIDGFGDGAAKQALERDAARISRLVDQLMAVARLEAGQVVIDGPIDLVPVAREVLAGVAPLAMAQGRAVELSAPDRPVMVRGNAPALGDALLNLVDNALRYTPEGGAVEVAVAPLPPHDDGDPPGALLEVSDRGPGIAPADRPQLFEPFWHGCDRRGTGSGLGLAIVAETVAVHGGSVAVLDRDGGGTVFRIELPGLTPGDQTPG